VRRDRRSEGQLGQRVNKRKKRHLNPCHGKNAIAKAFVALAEAAMDRKPVTGWTHNFYRYPARFSPRFAAAAIDSFSGPGELVLDPYMGGGTAVVEAVAAGRHVVGNDLNSLAAFVARVKVTRLQLHERAALQRWLSNDVPTFTFDRSSSELSAFIDLEKTKNLTLTRARFIKKAVAAALVTIAELPTQASRDFARCVVLRVSQWALDGRERHTPLTEFRKKLADTAREMLEAMAAFSEHAKRSGGQATILNGDAEKLDQVRLFREEEKRVSLVVTSPPYPGVHVLYHRWQVDGRRETPAPYWIAGCNDGQGASFYNFGDRREAAADAYFQTSLTTLNAIRRVVKEGGYVVQLVAFNRPEDQLPRYLGNMHVAGFAEVSIGTGGRIWRCVPHRKWHAALKGMTHSSNEVVLVHRAI
jgi:DNA modification methylase